MSAPIVNRLLGRKWNVPIAKTMWPFYISGAVILYGVNSAANAMALTDEHKNDPNNHIARRIAGANPGH